MSEEMNKEFEEMLDDVMGGILDVEDHSPDDDSNTEKSLGAENDAAPEAEEEFDPEGEGGTFADDSAQDEGKVKKEEGTPEKSDSVPEEKETVPDAEKTALQEELANYKKRLHDTQSAMHKANDERAKLQKELDALKKKKDADGEEEDWFKDDSGNDKAAELESKIEAIEEKQEKYQQEQAVSQWMAEAKEVAKKHEDFNALVFEKLEPLLDENTGDPAMLVAYMRWQDKSPAGAYEFAKRVFGTEEKLNKADTPPAEVKDDAKPLKDPSKGKAGLDRMNSAEFSESKRTSGNMIDEVFG